MSTPRTRHIISKDQDTSNENNDENYIDISDENEKDYIDHEFQSLILPINLMLAAFFLSKHSISNNIIRPNGHIYNLMSILGILSFVSIQIYRSYTITAYYFDGTMQYIATIVSCLLYALNYIILLILNIIHNENNVAIIKKVYAAHKFLKSFRNHNYNPIKIWNWAFLLLSFSINFFFISLHVRVMHQDCALLSYIFLFTLSEFDMAMLHAKCVLHLITIELNMLIKEIESYSELCTQFKDARHYAKRERHWGKLFQVYLDLMEAYDFYQKIIHLPVLIQVIIVFLHSLLYVQIFIELEKKQIFVQATMHVYMLEFIIAMWTLKTLVYIAVFSVECERFYSAARQADVLVARSVVFTKSEQCVRLCKNVRRVQSARFRRLSACGVFPLDAALIPKLAALLLSYTVVLLQIALDKHD